MRVAKTMFDKKYKGYGDIMFLQLITKVDKIFLVMYYEGGIVLVRAQKRKKQKKKGTIKMVKTLIPKKTTPTSIMGRQNYSVFVSNPVKNGSSLMSMVKYNEDSGEVKVEQRKSNND